MSSGSDRNVSLVEALQALAAEMAKAGTEAEAEAGLKKLRQIRRDFLGKENGSGAVNAARRDAEALIAWLEARLEQLKLQLARRRRAQEGEVMERLAKQREAEGPSLLPSELVDAVVHSTEARDPEAVTSTAPVKEPGPAEEVPDRKNTPAKEKEKKETEESVTGGAEKPTADKPEPAIPKPKPAPTKPEFTKYERLAAHLAASVGENSYFFEKLRKAAKRPGKAQKAPEDDKAAETHYRRVHDLNKRLVNLELHAKAIAKARSDKEPVSPLLKTAARELKNFLRDFRTAKEEAPELAGDYERRFGGWAEQLSAMKPEKGSAILDLCRAERRPKQPTAEQESEREAEAPQLVLKRDENWQQ